MAEAPSLLDGPYGGPAGFGSYFDVDNEHPTGETKMPQRNADIGFNFAPQATTNARLANMLGKFQVFGDYVSPMQLTIQEEDLVIIPKSDGEVLQTLSAYGYAPVSSDPFFGVKGLLGTNLAFSDFVESDRSPFAVFNGLKRPPRIPGYAYPANMPKDIIGEELYVTYRFLGVAEVGGPKYIDTYKRTDSLTVVPDGVVNYVNILDTPIEAGEYMTWDVTASNLLENLSGHTQPYNQPASKIPAHQITTLKAYFKPVGPIDKQNFFKSAFWGHAKSLFENYQDMLTKRKEEDHTAKKQGHDPDKTSADCNACKDIQGEISKLLARDIGKILINPEQLLKWVKDIKWIQDISGDTEAAILDGFIEKVNARVAAAWDIFESKRVGINMSRVGPHQRGQILLRPCH